MLSEIEPGTHKKINKQTPKIRIKEFNLHSERILGKRIIKFLS